MVANLLQRVAICCALYVYGFMIAGSMARLAGELGFALLIFCASVYILVYRPKIPISLILLCAVAFIYSFMSYFRSFNPSWTIYFDEYVILRQSICIPVFTLLFCVISDFVYRFWFLFRGIRAFIYFILIPFLSLSGSQYIFDRSGGVPNLIGPSISMFIGVALVMYPDQRKMRGLAGLCVGCVALFFASSNSQTVIACVLLLLVYINPYPRLAVFGTIFALGSIYFMIPYASQLVLHVDDPNVAIRLFIWSDAYELVRDSMGIGIGFGSEVIRNYYPLHAAISPFPPDQIMLISTHNTFVFFLARMGVLAFFLFVVFCLSIGLKIRVWKVAENKISVLAWMLGMLTLSINVAIESAIFVTGTAFALGLASGIQRAAAESLFYVEEEFAVGGT